MASIVRPVPEEPMPSEESPERPHRLLPLVDDIQIVPDNPSVKNDPFYLHEDIGGSPPAQGRRTRAGGRPLRRRLLAGDLAALGAAWGALAFVYRDRGLGRELAFAAASVLVTLVVMREVGLYRSRASLRSLETVA